MEMGVDALQERGHDYEGGRDVSELIRQELGPDGREKTYVRSLRLSFLTQCRSFVLIVLISAPHRIYRLADFA